MDRKPDQENIHVLKKEKPAAEVLKHGAAWGKKNLSQFNLTLQHSSSCVFPQPLLTPTTPLQLYTIFYFVKGHLGCCSVDGPVVWQSGDGNACWLACCHSDREREGERCRTAGTTRDSGLWIGKHRLQTPTLNLLIINQTHKNHSLPFCRMRHLYRPEDMLRRPPGEITPVWAQLKEVQLMLHLSVPIVNSVDSLPLLPKMPVFVYLLFCPFVCTCQTVAGKRNECLWVIRPVGEEEEKDEQRKWETDSNGGERGRESSLITSAKRRIDPVVWSGI